MNKKTLLTALSIIFLLGAVKTYPQDSQATYNYGNDDQYETGSNSGLVISEQHHSAYKTAWQKNDFKDNWYITFGSGAQILMAEDDNKGSFGDRITYAPTLTIGKYFSPIWGFRLQFTGGSLHGFNDGVAGTYRKWNSGSKNYMGKDYAGKDGYPKDINSAFFTWDPQWNRMCFSENNPDPNKNIVFNPTDQTYYWYPGLHNNQVYMQRIRYFAANFNFMFDLLTLIGDYNPKRLFNITPFGGFSYGHVFPHMGQTAYDVIGANGGVNIKIRLAEKFDLNLEGSLLVYPDDFDGHAGGSRSIDLVAQTTAGVSYKFGKDYWEVCEPMNYELLRDLNDRINDLRMQLKEALVPCPECPPCPEPEPVEEKVLRFLPDPVFFRINQSIIDTGEWIKIEKAVEYLKKYPEANVVVTGYADKKTGTPAYNQRLSEKRAKEVARALIENYGVNPLRITINWEGDTIQPFEVNEWNRVVVFVIED